VNLRQSRPSVETPKTDVSGADMSLSRHAFRCTSVSLRRRATHEQWRRCLMARDRERVSRVGAQVFVLLKREGDAREAVPIPALAEKRDRTGELELVCLRGDTLVRLAEDVLDSHG